MIEWISVNERLPEQNGMWLCAVATDDGPEVHTLMFSRGKWIHEGEYTFEHGYYFRPKYWAKLPDTPQGMEDEPEDETGEE